MFDNKILINLYVLALDKQFELFIPVDEKIGNIVNLVDKNLISLLKRGKIKQFVLLNLYSGSIYQNNDIIRNTDIKNGTKLILI
mgnify:CR=1 FL=1